MSQTWFQKREAQLQGRVTKQSHKTRSETPPFPRGLRTYAKRQIRLLHAVHNQRGDNTEHGEPRSEVTHQPKDIRYLRLLYAVGVKDTYNEQSTTKDINRLCRSAGHRHQA